MMWYTQQRKQWTVLAACLILAACSKGSDEPPPQSTGPASELAASAPSKSMAPAPQTDVAMPAQVPQQGTVMESAGGATAEGVVVSTIDIPDSKTMYVELDMGGKRQWIAAPMMELAAGERVRYSTEDAVLMENFKSTSLDRTFEKLLLVSGAEKVE